MKVRFGRALIEWLARQSKEVIRRFLERMSPRELLRLDCDFESWAQDGQHPPKGEGWRTWLLMAGRGFGKTRAGAEWVHRLARRAPGVRIALVSATLAEARSVMIEGPSGLIAVAANEGVRLTWEPSLGRLRWPGGGAAQAFSGDHADGLRGAEHHFAWADELAKWGEADEAWDNLQMGLRAGPRPRALVTTTPKVMPLLNRIRGDRWTVESKGRTADNLNLGQRFIDIMLATYGGTRKGRQELDGELMVEAEGSLWPRELIERCRVLGFARDERVWDKIVVGVDPPAGAGEGCDACGIVVAGRSAGRIYVLADASVQGASPERWARAVAGAAEAWGASLIVAEANQGGVMVESVLLAADAGLRVKLVHASRGKVARAEPVATRFEAGKAFFAAVFPELEAELSGLAVGGSYEGPGRSPDRADAMVWAMTELGETKSGVPRVRML